MANEIFAKASIAFEKGKIRTSHSGSIRLDVAGDRYTKIVQNIGTSEEAVDLGDIGTVGMIFVVNRDTTNFVELRPGSGIADLIKIRPGGFAMFELAASATLYAIADTAACDVEFLIIEA